MLYHSYDFTSHGSSAYFKQKTITQTTIKPLKLRSHIYVYRPELTCLTGAVASLSLVGIAFCSPMDFDSIFGATSTTSKQFEARWFFDFPLNCGDSSLHDDDDDDRDDHRLPYKVRVHRMPFQRRTLSYWVGTQYGSQLHKKDNNLQRRSNRRNTTIHKSHTRSMKKRQQSSAGSTSQKLDLLFDIWKHRVRNCNDALLCTPRRNARTYSKENSTSVSQKTQGVVHLAPISPTPAAQGDMNSNNEPAHCFPMKNERDRIIEKSFEGIATKEVCIQPLEIIKEGMLMNTNAPPDIASIRPAPIAALVAETEDSITLGNGDHRPGGNATHTSELDDINDLLDWKPPYPDRPSEFLRSTDSDARVLFHFLFVNDDQQTCFLTDATPENYPGHRRCIFCFFDGASDAGLLMHCVTCHGQFLTFKGAMGEDGTLHIAMTKKVSITSSSPVDDSRDFVYVRRASEAAGYIPCVPFVKRSPSRVRNMDLQTRWKKMQLLMDIGADETTRMQFVPNSEVPIRQYFHSRSNEPMLPGEWDVDSDDEIDEGWLTNMGEQLMDEFEDVTRDEKRFCKLWNRFITSHIVIADQAIPSKCFNFVRTHATFLVEHDLRQELMLHFMGFWDSGLISSTHLMDLMAEFDKIKSEIDLNGGVLGTKNSMEKDT